MKLSVIIPAYNDAVGVLSALNSLQQFQKFPRSEIEYLVQDDASPQVFMSAVVNEALASVERNLQNKGFGGNCNAGAARAQGDVLFFVNQDIFGVPEFSHGWDVALLSAFDNPNVAIVGPKLLFPNGAIQSCGGEFDGFRQPFHRCLGYANPFYEEVNTPRPVRWVTGAALAIRRIWWDKAGGFNPIYGRGYFEDVHLCLEVWFKGGIIWYEPTCTLIHRVGSTGGNPDFGRNARLFRDLWAMRIEPDTMQVKVRYW